MTLLLAMALFTGIALKQLWLQAKVKAGELLYTKIPPETNSADSLAKSWSTDGLCHFRRLHFAIPVAASYFSKRSTERVGG